jgi:hypothetical protein
MKYKGQIFCSKSCKGKQQAKESLEVAIEKYNTNPKVCPQCGKAISFEKRSNKFCSRSCASSYTNHLRIRKGWTDEARRKFSKQLCINEENSKYSINKCKYCGEIINGKNTNTCNDCLPYVPYLRTFRKLGLTGGLKSSYERTKNIFISKYFDEKYSITKISRTYNVDVTTIYRFLKLDHREIRDKSTSIHETIVRGEFNPIQYNPSNFKTGIHKRWNGKEYRFRSSLEDEFMNLMDEQNIEYLYEPLLITF